MGSNQQFSLRWNNYLSHITGAFDSLRNDDELVDVTLSCEGKRIRAHKMLLSVCSTYFRDLFKENPCQHPVIIFRNVKFDDLVALIDFMYHGEVNVMQEQLTSFLTTAELLAIQGLSEDKGKEKENEQKRSPPPEESEQVDLTDSPPPAQETDTAMSTSSHVGLLRHNRQHPTVPRSSPSTPSFFSSTSNIERRPESPPNKRRRWSSTQPSLSKTSPVPIRKTDDSVSVSPPPPSPLRRPVRPPTPEEVEMPQPSTSQPVKMEVADFVEEPRTQVDPGPMSSGAALENDSLAGMAELVAKTESMSSPAGADPPDLSDLYGGSSRDDGATSDSLSAVELSQILAKPGPSGDNQNQDSMQDCPHHLSVGRRGILGAESREDNADKQPPFVCDICGKPYMHASSLRSHQELHKGQTSCPLCKKVFSTKHYLKVHMEVIHRVSQDKI